MRDFGTTIAKRLVVRLTDGVQFIAPTTPADTQPTSVADGANVALGHTSDNGMQPTLLGRVLLLAVHLNAIRALLPQALTSQGNLRVSVEEVKVPTTVNGTVTANQGAPGAQAWPVQVTNPTDVGALAKDATLKDGTQKTQVTNFPADQPVTVSNPTDVSALATEDTLEAASAKLDPLAKDATLKDGTQKTQVTNFPADQQVTVSNPTDVSALATQATLSEVLQRLVDILARQADGNQKTQVTNTVPVSGALVSGTQSALEIVRTAGVPVASVWTTLLRTMVPAGVRWNISFFRSSSSAAGYQSAARVGRKLGAYTIGTQAFTDGETFASPRVIPELWAEVTTQIAGAVTLTITYVNSAGVAGRTATVTLPNSAPVGARYPVTLQAGDFGVLDVTAVSRSAAATGAVDIWGSAALAIIRHASSNLWYDASMQLSPIVVYAEAGESVFLDIWASSTQNATRELLLGIVPTPA